MSDSLTQRGMCISRFACCFSRIQEYVLVVIDEWFYLLRILAQGLTPFRELRAVLRKLLDDVLPVRGRYAILRYVIKTLLKKNIIFICVCTKDDAIDKLIGDKTRGHSC